MHGVRLWKSLVKPLRFSHVEANVLILVRKILPLHLCSKRNLSYLMFVSLPAQSFILGVNRRNRGRIFPIMFIEEPQARLAQLRRKMGLALFHRCLWDPASMVGASTGATSNRLHCLDCIFVSRNLQGRIFKRLHNARITVYWSQVCIPPSSCLASIFYAFR